MSVRCVVCTTTYPDESLGDFVLIHDQYKWFCIDCLRGMDEPDSSYDDPSWYDFDNEWDDWRDV
jgi:hypothetical protein